ncbi:MAG: hypothetical protein JXA08_04095 [Methanomicrobiaceae archaeon]|nr:hypothetical protein [Methanomicrobiaceae archaeon]
MRLRSSLPSSLHCTALQIHHKHTRFSVKRVSKSPFGCGPCRAASCTFVQDDRPTPFAVLNCCPPVLWMNGTGRSE